MPKIASPGRSHSPCTAAAGEFVLTSTKSACAIACCAEVAGTTLTFNFVARFPRKGFAVFRASAVNENPLDRPHRDRRFEAVSAKRPLPIIATVRALGSVKRSMASPTVALMRKLLNG